MLRIAMLCALLPALASGATYHCSLTASGNNDGTSEANAWETLADADAGLDALGDDGADDTVIFYGNGDYGPLTGGVWIKARVGTLTLQANTGDSPQFSTAWNGQVINLTAVTQTDIDLVIDGFTGTIDDPDPLPAQDGAWHYGNTQGVYASKVTGLQLLNCNFVGPPTSHYFCKDHGVFTDCVDLVINGCSWHGCLGGIDITTCTDYTIQNNNFYDMKGYGAIRLVTNAYGDCVVTGNTIYNSHYSTGDNWFPTSGVPAWHASSDLYVKMPGTGTGGTPAWNTVTISANKIYDTGGSAQSLYLHEAYPKDGLIIENNLIYDMSSLRLNGLIPSAGRPIYIRNNTFIAGRANLGCGSTNLPDRFVSIPTMTAYSGYAGDGTGLFFTNNLCVGQTQSTGYWPEELAGAVQTNNLFWAPVGSTAAAWEGNDFYAVWKLGSSTLHGYTDLFEWSTCSYATAEYTPNGVENWNSFFVNAVLSGYTAGEDYHLTAYASSTYGTAYAIDHGSTTANYYSTTDLDGNARDATPDIGAYEYDSGATLPDPATSPTPADAATEVSLTQDLSWTAGAGATSHNIYWGTSQPPTYRGNVDVAVLTYDTGTMPNATTYYWRIDEVNDAGTTTGTQWSFTTAVSPYAGAPSVPFPYDNALRMPVSLTLTWTGGSGATGHKVYLSDADGSTMTLLGSPAGVAQATGTLQVGARYLWRVDEIKGEYTTTGPTWSFRTVGYGDKRFRGMRQ